MEYWDIYDKDKQLTGRKMKRNDWCLKEDEYHLTVLGVIRRPDGSLDTVTAAYTVLASGGVGGLYRHSTNFRHLTGDALAIAGKHNIELQNPDYVQIHPTTFYTRHPEDRSFLISESVRGEGARLYDKNMNRFVNELLPRDLLSQKIHEQMAKDGTDFVWEDLRTIPAETLRHHFPNIVEHCREMGYDVFKECIPVVPAQHYFMGGVKVDYQSRSSMENLYVVGEAACNGVHGKNRLASNSLLESLVFARRAAQDMAEHALDMAQGRGGDQAAEMTLDGFTFYGGVSHGVEKRSKVRSRLVADQLVKLIKEADHVVIMGHRMSDLDAIGAAEGVLRICKICDVPAVIAVRRDATLAASLIDALCKAGQKDDFIDPKDALPIISKRTLCIVVDTYQVGLVESKDILEKCGKVAVIDHHRKGVGYIENPALVCHEPYSSSASELVTELLQYVGERDDKPNRVEAEGLLAGILLDTQDFTLHTGVRTFEAAAALRRYGAETERVRRLFDVTMVEYNAKADLVEKAQMYKNCAISIGGEVAPEARVAIAQAANDLLRIQGVDASFVAVQVGNGVNVSARSMGAVNVQVIMESLGGGGHQTMAAAQLKHITPQAARSRIQDAIDQYYLSQKKTTPEARPAKGE